jgi:hypothetical protein
VLGVAVAIIPIGVAAVDSALEHRVPVGDNALITIRAGDVGTAHHPLLGTWSSASLNVDTDLRHPGPLYFDLLALPVRLLGPEGVALGVAAVNIGCIVGIALVASRRGGPLPMAVATLVAAALSWSMGSELVVEPWQPHAMLLPFLLFLFLVWSVTCGDAPSLPWAAAVGSLVLQTHLSHALLVPVLGTWAGICLLVDARGAGREAQRRATKMLALAGAVLALCWSQPLWEQLTGSGSGNLSRLLTSAGGGDAKLGFSVALRIAAMVLTIPAWWLQPSFSDAWLPSTGDTRPEQSELPSILGAMTGLTLLAAVVAAAAWLARRGHDRDGGRALAIACLALAMGVITAAIVPIGVFGISPHQFRWLWPIAAFTTFAVGATVVRALATSDRRRGWLVGAAVVGTSVVAILTLTPGEESDSSPLEGVAIASGLATRLGVLEGEGPLLVEPPPTFNDPYVPAIMAELQHRGIPFLVEPEMTRHLGERRRVDDHEARALLSLGFGDDPAPPPGGREVVRYRSVAVFLTPVR